MAAIVKVGSPTVSSPHGGTGPSQTTGFVAGEALGVLDACYVKTSDGKVYRSTGAAANAAAEVDGYADKSYTVGEKGVTLFHGGTNVVYGSALSPGARVYLSESVPGGFDDALGAAGGTRKLGFVVDATRIRLYSVQGR